MSRRYWAALALMLLTAVCALWPEGSREVSEAVDVVRRPLWPWMVAVLGAGLLGLLIWDAISPRQVLVDIRADLAAAFPVEALRKLLAAFDEAMVLLSLIGGVALTQLVDVNGKRTGATEIDWIAAVPGFVVSAVQVYSSEQGDRAGKTRTLKKMILRWLAAASAGLGWTALIGTGT